MLVKVFTKREKKYIKTIKEWLVNEEKFITEILPLIKSVKIPFEEEITFKTILSTPQKQTYVLQLLEDLSITVNGKYALSPKRKGAIRGVVEALREKNIVPNLSLEELNNAIASKINLELKSKLDWSKTSDDYKMKTFKYIENKPFQKET